MDNGNRNQENHYGTGDGYGNAGRQAESETLPPQNGRESTYGPGSNQADNLGYGQTGGPGYGQTNGAGYSQANGPGYGPWNANPGNAYQNPGGQDRQEPVTVGEWLIVMLIMCIPCANIIMMFIWAFSKNEKKSKSNYFKASLIWTGIAVVLAVLFYIFIIASSSTVFSSF